MDFSGAKIGTAARGPVETSNETAGAGRWSVAEEWLHELRFMLFCFRIASRPALRTPACPSCTVSGLSPLSPFPPPALPLLLPALEGGRGFDVSDAGEKMKDETESVGEDPDEPLALEVADCALYDHNVSSSGWDVRCARGSVAGKTDR